MCFQENLFKELLLQIGYEPYQGRLYDMSGMVSFTPGHTFLNVEEIKYAGNSILESPVSEEGILSIMDAAKERLKERREIESLPF
jgi:hypothetical protein